MNQEPSINSRQHFKNQLIQFFIPRIKAMAELERLHLHFLIDMNAPTDFINKSQETHLHLIEKIKEYTEYAESI